MTAASVSVIGLGLLGSAVAGATAAAGLKTTVWNRSPARAEAFRKGPASVAATIEDALDASDVIVACLQDYQAMEDVLRVATINARL